MKQIDLHPGQSKVYKALFLDLLYKFIVVVASRGWGKSYFACVAAISAVLELLDLDESIPNKNVYIVAPTHDQVIDIYWPILTYDLQVPCIKSSRELGRFVFPKNVELRLVSYEAIERMRGKGAYFVVLDELSSWTKGLGAKGAWQGIIQPAIITRWSDKRAQFISEMEGKFVSPGRAVAITTPKGYDFTYEAYNYREKDPVWGGFKFDYRTSPYLDAEEIDRIRHTIDPIEFASEYLAEFKESGASLFYCFDRNKHVRKLPYFRDDEDVHCCIDFNVRKQCTSMFALRGKQMHFLDEVKGHPDTDSLARYLRDKYSGHKIIAYPDPTGKRAVSSAPVGVTDLNILRSYGIDVRARNKSPKIVDSVNAVNRHLLTASGDINMYFDPSVQMLIESMERTRWAENNPELATIDKSEDIEHFSDGVRYGTEWLFPIQAGNKRVVRGFNF